MSDPCSVPRSWPFLLEVFLAQKTLTFDQLKQAVDVISLQSRDKYIQDKFNGQVKICFTGGEPLLEFELLKEAVRYIHTKEPGFEIEVVTNGTLLTENGMDFFARNNVEICLRLDGRRFESVMSNLKKGPINKRYVNHFHVVAVLTSQTIDSLPDVVKFFRHDVGVKQLEIEVESYEIWSRAGIKRLRNVLRSLKSRFLATLEHEMDIKNIEFAFREFLFSRHEERDYHATNITLCYDGYFYPSDFVVKPLERKYRIGDLEHGIDFKRLETISSLSMFADVSRKCLRSGYKSGLLSPVERYCWGIIHKFTPDRMNRLLKNTSQVNRVFNEEVGCYVRLQRIYERLVMTPSFGDFAHLPKCRGNKEIKSFRLIIRNDSDIGRLREGIDYFLYSPGKEKKLILDVMDTSTEAQTALDVMEGMILYVLIKAGYLEKRIKLMVACEAGDTPAFDENRWRYLNENGVRVEAPVL